VKAVNQLTMYQQNCQHDSGLRLSVQ